MYTSSEIRGGEAGDRKKNKEREENGKCQEKAKQNEHYKFEKEQTFLSQGLERLCAVLNTTANQCRVK